MRTIAHRPLIAVVASSLALLPLLLRGTQESEPAGGRTATDAQDGADEPPAPRRDALAELIESLATAGIALDLEGELVSIDVGVGVRDQLIEYLLVGPGGASHESLLYTRVQPSLLNAALLALGASPGKNATWVEVEATDDEAGEGDEGADDRPPPRRPTYRVVPPHGDGFYLHVAWREGDEVYFFRVEDLIANLETGRAMRRAPFVFLGSRMATLDGMVHPLQEQRDPDEVPDEDEVMFIADFERNLINLVYFSEGNTLLTAVHGPTNREDVWAANIWNLPETDQTLRLILSRAPLDRVPDALEQSLPVVVRPATPTGE